MPTPPCPSLSAEPDPFNEALQEFLNDASGSDIVEAIREAVASIKDVADINPDFRAMAHERQIDNATYLIDQAAIALSQREQHAVDLLAEIKRITVEALG